MGCSFLFLPSAEHCWGRAFGRKFPYREVSASLHRNSCPLSMASESMRALWAAAFFSSYLLQNIAGGELSAENSLIVKFRRPCTVAAAPCQWPLKA